MFFILKIISEMKMSFLWLFTILKCDVKKLLIEKI